jgi:PAS domain S-box-containing protein
MHLSVGKSYCSIYTTIAAFLLIAKNKIHLSLSCKTNFCPAIMLNQSTMPKASVLLVDAGQQVSTAHLQAYQQWICLLEAANVSFVFIDQYAQVQYSSTAAGALLQKVPEKLYQQNIIQFFTNETPTSFEQWLLTYLAQPGADAVLEVFTTIHQLRVQCRLQAIANSAFFCVQFSSIKMPATALAGHDEKYKTLIEQAYDAILIYRPDGTLLEYNEKSCSYLGYTYEEMGTLQLKDLFFEQELKEHPIQLKSLYKGKAVVDYRQLKRKDGTGIMMELNSKMIHDGTIVVFGRDVTDRIRATQNLNEERGLLRAIIDNLADPIYVKNLKGEKIIANKEDQLYMGAKAEADVVGKTDLELYPGQVGETGHRQDLAIMQNNLPVHNREEYFVDAKGIAHWLLVSKIPLHNQNGAVVGLLGIGREITQRKEMEAELIRSIERYRNVARATFDAIWDWDIATGDIYRGEGFETLFGYLPSSRQGYTQDWNSMIHPDDFENWNQSFQAALANRDIVNWQWEYRFQKANGDYAVVADKAIIIRDGNGQATRMVGAMQDVSLQKKTEQILAATQKRYRALVENSSDGIAVIDPEGNPTYISPSVVSILGYTEEEAMQLNVFGISHPDDIELLTKTYEYAIENPGVPVKGYTSRLKHKDGSWRWLEDTVTNLLHDPAINGFIENFRDVTERIAIEKRILAEKELSDSLVNSLPGIFILCGADGRLIRWNNNLENVTGIATGQLISYTLPQLFTPAQADEVQAMMQVAIHTQSTAEINFLTPVGEAAYFVTVHKISYENEECLMLMCFDISQRKKQETDLALINERYEYVTLATSDVVWDWDLIKNVLYWGENFYKLFGHPRVSPDTSLQQWTAFLHPDDSERVSQSLHDMLDNGKSIWYEEYRFMMSNGEYIHIQDNGVVLRDENGQAYRLIGAMHDVTRQKLEALQVKMLNEELSKKALALSNSNKELEKFAYVASHDLQEPLRMVSSFLTLLEKKYQHLMDETASSYIQFAVDGAHRMRSLILDLLEYSRVSTGHFEAGDTDLNQIITEVKSVLTISIEEAGATITVPKLPVLYGTKRVLIFQLFQNLIANALKYRRAEPAVIHISFEDRAAEWYFEIADNGMGIDPVFAEKVFVIFQRLHNKNEYAGTGIGLSICKKIVELHGGKIWVTPNTPFGSIFLFTINKQIVSN